MSSLFAPSGKCIYCGIAVRADYFLCQPCDRNAEAASAARDERDRDDRIRQRMRQSGLPVAYVTSARSASDVPPSEIYGRISALLHAIGTPEIPGIFMFGPSQSYKTTIAAAFLAGVIRADKIGRFVDVTDMMTDIQRSYRDDDFDSRAEIVDRFALTPMLVLDDLGQEKASHHAGEVIRQILDRRRRNWSLGQWLIVTSNFTPEELRDRFEEPQTGNAILHRIAQLTVAVPMQGGSDE